MLTLLIASLILSFKILMMSYVKIASLNFNNSQSYTHIFYFNDRFFLIYLCMDVCVCVLNKEKRIL